jgi:hypothetical protein
MKISELLNESSTCLVARFYKEPEEDLDLKFNKEISKYKGSNQEYYREFFDDWFSKGVTPVFDKPTKKDTDPYYPRPKKGDNQSAGWRGKQTAFAGAGLPYNKNIIPPKEQIATNPDIDVPGTRLT